MLSPNLHKLGMGEGQGRNLLSEPELKHLNRLARKNPETTIKELGEAVQRHCGVKVSGSTL
jgi:hypothetical protein